MIEIDEPIETSLSTTTLSEDEAKLLEPVLSIDIDEDGMDTCRVDLDRLIQIMTLYDSIAVFRYDWRRRRLDDESKE